MTAAPSQCQPRVHRRRARRHRAHSRARRRRARRRARRFCARRRACRGCAWLVPGRGGGRVRMSKKTMGGNTVLSSPTSSRPQVGTEGSRMARATANQVTGGRQQRDAHRAGRARHAGRAHHARHARCESSVGPLVARCEPSFRHLWSQGRSQVESQN
jgi:hypothetical protein